MNKSQRNAGNNVVQMPAKPGARRKAPPQLSTAADGSPDDPRMQEALRLAKAFLAIEDPQARGALVALAESLVGHDWPLDAKRL